MTNFRVYFAGELFDHKHLIGNAILAEAIERPFGGPLHLRPAAGPRAIRGTGGRYPQSRSEASDGLRPWSVQLRRVGRRCGHGGGIHDGEVSRYPRSYSSFRFPFLRRTGKGRRRLEPDVLFLSARAAGAVQRHGVVPGSAPGRRKYKLNARAVSTHGSQPPS